MYMMLIINIILRLYLSFKCRKEGVYLLHLVHFVMPPIFLAHGDSSLFAFEYKVQCNKQSHVQIALKDHELKCIHHK
jgi:hypothetical protein